MKKTVYFLCVFTLAFSLFSCTDPDEDNQGQQQPDETSQHVFYGTLTVGPDSEQPFVMDSVKIAMVESDTTDNLTMIMYKVRFASRMPMLDIKVEGIDAETNQDVTVLQADSIIPWAVNGYFATYIITNLDGDMTDDSLFVSMNCGTFPITYTGGR